MAETSNVAKLPEGPRVSKYAEITPDPGQLKLHAHVAAIKPGSGVVVVYTARGEVLARYFDREFAEGEFEEAGLKLEDFLGANVAKKEADAARENKRAAAMPNRRLRGERRKATQQRRPTKPEEAAA